MHGRNRMVAHRQHAKPVSEWAAGFTLLEVMIAAALAVVVIAALAAAGLSAARTNREAANLGAPERALHAALEVIANDLRANNGTGAYACGKSANQRAPIPINGYSINWNTFRVALDAKGNPTQQASCGAAHQQGTLLVRATTQDRGATHTRETIVSLTRGATPMIANFTSNLTEVRPGDSITLQWQLAPDPPAGTVTYLNGERVDTNADSLTGSATLQITESTAVELVADSPFGDDRRVIHIVAGNAPIYRVLRTEPERYTPGQPLTFHWEIDPAPLTLTGAQRVSANGISAHTIPTTPGANGRTRGQHTVNIPSNRSGTLTFPFTATSSGGTTRKSIAIPECPVPGITLRANPSYISQEGRINSSSTLTWTTSNPTSATLRITSTGLNESISIPSNQLASGSHTLPVSVARGGYRTYTATLTAASDCGRDRTVTATITLDSYEPPPPPECTVNCEDDDDEDENETCTVNCNPRPPTRNECEDIDIDPVYCACSEGPPPMVVCLPRGDDDPGDGGGGGDDPPVVIDP